MRRLYLLSTIVVVVFSTCLQAAPGFGIRPDPIEFIGPPEQKDIYIEAVGEGWITGMNLVLGVVGGGFELSDLRITGVGSIWEGTNCSVEIYDFAGGGSPTPQYIAATVIPEHPVRAPGIVAVVRLDYVFGYMGWIGMLTTDLTNDPYIQGKSDWLDAAADFQATALILDIPEPNCIVLILAGVVFARRSRR